MDQKFFTMIACLLGAGGVAIGAYHAHGLEKSLLDSGLEGDALVKQMHNCEVAVRYQMYHALALLAVGTLAAGKKCLGLRIAGWGFLVGVLLFSGGLLVTVFSELRPHWAIVPSGGMLLIVAWLALAAASFGSRGE